MATANLETSVIPYYKEQFRNNTGGPKEIITLCIELMEHIGSYEDITNSEKKTFVIEAMLDIVPSTSQYYTFIRDVIPFVIDGMCSAKRYNFNCSRRFGLCGYC